MTTATPPSLRRDREYLLWLGGDVAAGIGAEIGMFAFPLITFAVTGSTVATGVVGLVQGIGQLAGMLPGGVIADRYDRRRLRLLSSVLGALAQVVLIAVLVGGAAGVAVLAVLAAADRFRASLLGSASDAMLKQLVTPEQLPTAVSVNQGRDAAIALGSGPIGGALLALHLAVPAGTQLVGNLVSALCTLLMRGDYRPRTAGAPPTRALADLRDGARWILSQPVRMQISAAAALVNLGANGALLSVTLMLAADGVSALRIGLLTTAFAISLLIGSVMAPRVVAAVPTGALIVLELTLIAMITAIIPALPGFWWIVGAYAVLGIGLAPLNAATMGFFTHITPVQMQGRAGAFSGLLSMGLLPLAPALAGFGLEAWGAGMTLGIFAGVCAAGALVVALGGQARRIPASGEWESYAVRTGMVPSEQPEQPEPSAGTAEAHADPAASDQISS